MLLLKIDFVFINGENNRFYYEVLQLIRQSKDSSFFLVFLLKWIRHFLQYYYAIAYFFTHLFYKVFPAGRLVI